MVMDVTPNPVQYRVLSEHFQACADLSEREREEYLSGPKVPDASLREELRCLLQYHARPSGPTTRPMAAEPAPARALPGSRKRPFLVPFLVLGTSSILLALALRAWTLGRLEASTKAEALQRLQQILELRISSIRAWTSREKELARSVLEDPTVVAHVAALVESSRAAGALEGSLRASPSYLSLSSLLTQAPGKLTEHGFWILNPAGLVLCSDSDAAVGTLLPLGTASFLRGVARGEWTVSRPVPDRQLGLKLDRDLPRPVLFAAGPVCGAKGQVIAFGVFLFSPHREFYGMLSLPGPAELVAFDEKGLLLNNLKDPARLRKLGLLPDQPDDQSALRLHLRDPGRELKAGGRSEAPSDHRAPTRMCLAAPQGGIGRDVTGYRNLAGRPVVGTWSWLPEQEMGIGVEEELDSLLAPLQPARVAFLLLALVPAVVMAGLLVHFGGVHFRGGRQEARIGFYILEGPIGQGGMGDVFRAVHSILSRPAAIKILREARPDSATVARFKREARMASRLGHPNSIQIFDYGETPDGRLYYAMEYVDGVNLAQLVTLDGPLSVARSLYLLKQISGALEEAHALNLLHRDLKPSNIMVGRKGGLGDVVKILDFGIASSVSGLSEDVTRSTSLIGTPAYLAPERIRRPDQLDFRSDVYSFGAVAFHMLTGRSIFEGPGPTELIYQVLTSKRPSPSRLRGDALPDALEGLVLDCLAIEPGMRPSSMREVAQILKSIETTELWSQDEARAWWIDQGERIARFKGATP